MPDAIGEDPSNDFNPHDSAPLTPPDAAASGEDGIVTEEQVQKGYVWMNEVNNNIFETTYEEMVDYFGVDGLFVKEEYSDHMTDNERRLEQVLEFKARLYESLVGGLLSI